MIHAEELADLGVLNSFVIEPNTLFRLDGKESYRIKDMYPLGQVNVLILSNLSEPNKTLRLEIVNP